MTVETYDHTHHESKSDDEKHIDEANVTIEEQTLFDADGKIHCDEKDPKTGLTLPAKITKTGRWWYKHGNLHRDDVVEGLTLPAVIEEENGLDFYAKMEWYKDGKLHRTDLSEEHVFLPAVVIKENDKFIYKWYQNGVLDRGKNLFDLPCIITSDYRAWYRDGKLHRSGDLPAEIYTYDDNSVKMVWYLNGKIGRRTDQPAEVFIQKDKNGIIIYKQESFYDSYSGKLNSIGNEPAVIDSKGYKAWYADGVLHRKNDDPAEILADGTQKWYKNGLLHRDYLDKPAIIDANGSKSWYFEGKLHRNVINTEGSDKIRYYINRSEDMLFDIFISTGGDRILTAANISATDVYKGKQPPAYIHPDGTQIWSIRGEVHRASEDGPAKIDADGTRHWLQNGKYFRENNLPVKIDAIGNKFILENGRFIKI